MKATGFVETIESVGFTLASDRIWFYRKRSDLIDCIILQPLAAGKGVRLSASVLRLDMYPEYDASTFPKGFTSHARNIANKYISEDGIGFSTGDWDTSGVGRFEKAFSAISDLLESDIVPWFDDIDSSQKLYDSIFEDLRTEGKYDYLLTLD